MYHLKTIQEEYLEGRISPYEAVRRIEGEAGEILRVDFKADANLFKIMTRKGTYKLDPLGIRKRRRDRLNELAVLVYHIAKKNGSIFPGEVHISRTASTKDHMDGIRYILNKCLPSM